MIDYKNLTGYDLVAVVAYNAGFRDDALVTAVSIAQAESSCNPAAIGDTTLQDAKWGPSYGLWQVRSLKHPEQYSNEDLMRIADKLPDAQYNANIAYLISHKGTNFKPWSTYTDNSYKKYVNSAIAAINRLNLVQTVVDGITTVAEVVNNIV